MYGHYLGIDLHRQRTYKVLDAQGQVNQQRRFENDKLEAYIKDLPKDTLVVIEATGNWGWCQDRETNGSVAIFVNGEVKPKHEGATDQT
jgi:hypothetical protein